MEFFSVNSEKQKQQKKKKNEKDQQANAMIINLIDLNPNVSKIRRHLKASIQGHKFSEWIGKETQIIIIFKKKTF